MGVRIPTPESVDAGWLTGLLRGAGHAGATVRGLTSERIGTGQIGRCFRFTMDLDGAGPEVPRTLVGKFPSEDEVSRATGVGLGLYRKEVQFYRELAPRLSIALPRCYYAGIDDRGPEFALMLEDMAPARPGDQIAGCSPAVARAAVLQLPGLHAPTWNDVSLRNLDWVVESSGGTKDLYGQLFPGFLARYGKAFEPDIIDILSRVVDSKGPPFVYPDDPFSVVHIDYRLDNLLIDTAQSPPRVTVVDWQSFILGSPLSDVAYLMGASLLPEVRRPIESEIVRAYHEKLIAAGVPHYGWDQCWSDYRRGCFAGFAVAVVASMIVQETPRGNEMFIAMASRHARHALDLGAQEFLT